ncbi:NAD-dependent epimerase/dehydratase family protein [Francisella sp. TX07-6608]|uniref:polysaccharide biosynthesis C-terminal domain-containing protein n=1 Tax=Francisella sp. TX07-6608 TaxID=573568 RepID=UPI0008F9E303|nr:NAD-dependent epimerase/dehydratase family protein [Francisella sp. TX07-6608]OIN83384.1 capsular polysaccharide synthesis enzyme Cap5F [Francisella sp. TX07-6608]
MKVLVTGANGFVGKNLCAELENLGYQLYKYSRESDIEELDLYTKKCDFVFHLAGSNRPVDNDEFKQVNTQLTQQLFDLLAKNGNNSPVVLSSSIQANKDNDYGVSKRLAEEAALASLNKAFIFRLPNVFGKWSKPNYNTVVATFCYNIARDIPISINDKDALLNLVYIDDLIKDFIKLLKEHNNQNSGYKNISKSYEVTLGKIVELIYSFKSSRQTLEIANMFDEFTKKLYSTYLSFLPKDQFSYPLRMNIDDRGSFTEFLRLDEKGQVSVNISKPGITKGQHWHHTKNEKFLVVGGKGVIRFRNIYSQEIIEYYVSSDKLEVVDIPTGYTHNIENLGDTDMVTIMWANEYFDKNNPDTYFLKV